MMKQLTLLIALTLALFASSLTAFADTVTLNDGTVHEGEIVNETDAYLYLRISVGSISTDKLIEKRNVKTIERTARDEMSKDMRTKGDEMRKQVEKKLGPGVEKIAFISMGDPPNDMVGPFMNAEALSNSIDILNNLPEAERPDTVVLVFNSGGGALIEIQPLMDVITDEIRPKYRTVAWIKSAISAAAMTAWAVPEIYFQTKGNFGACTGFSTPNGQAVQVDGRDLQEVLKMMEDASLLCDYDPAIMRSMQICGPAYPTTLSADIDEHGNVTWYVTDDPDAEPEGEYLVSKHNEILTFDAVSAYKFKFSKGTADTKDQLAKLMGCEEWVEVGYDAEDYMLKFLDRTADAQNRVNELATQLQIAMDQASSSRGDCAKWIGKATRLVGQIKSTVRGTSLTKYTQFQDEWFEVMNDIITDLRKQCAESTRS